MNRHLLFSAFLSACLLPLAGCESPSPVDPGAGGGAVQPGRIDFATQVKPILRERCVMCHNKKTMPERHSFETRALVMKGDKSGPILVPGKPESSRLLLAINAPQVHDKAMPPVSLRVTGAEIAILTQWIREGAPWPSGKAGRITPRNIPLE